MNSDSKKLRWGILGLGKISNQFVNDLKLIEDVEIVACASRSISNAINFAGQYEISRSYDKVRWRLRKEVHFCKGLELTCEGFVTTELPHLVWMKIVL